MTETPDDEDRDLMLALAGGNDPALNVLMRRWSPRLVSFLERLTGSHATACDLAQETFVRVYKHRFRYRPALKFSTWLYTIAGNLARNQARWQKRHPLTLMEPGELHRIEPEAETPTPAEDMEKQERARAVRQAVMKLAPEQRETLVLSTYESMSHAEIAGIMGTTTKVVEMRLYRARKELREMLRKLL
ncbi:MAG TPA: sigma-70 family RNA polymerase sigma factor [Prosthecobacter sp.]|nr:sigma-70 family RNA polymerase sigma factor [Prosthecobacter sp.]HRK15777.1 sigma-70 family RNA polymerase sigma factor [Prosthecobacter sp.]